MVNKNLLEEIIKVNKLKITNLTQLDETGDPNLLYAKSHSKDVLQISKIFRDKYEETGYWPVILRDDEACLRAAYEDSQTGLNVAQDLQVLDSFDLEIWFSQRRLKNRFWRGEWPTEPWINRQFPILYQIEYQVDETGKNRMRYVPINREVFIAFIPTPFSWMTPLYLSWWTGGEYWDAGSNRELPEPQVIHAAVLKHWNYKYGAEVICHGFCRFNLESRLPQTKESALELAEEFELYSHQTFDEFSKILSGKDRDSTLEEIAAYLMNSPVWLLWWS